MAYGSSSSASNTTITPGSATDYSGTGILSTSNDNAELGVDNAKDLRTNLGKISDYFDKRLTGSLSTFSFNFNSQHYDIIFCSLTNSGMSDLSAEILSYEIIALSKMYDVNYDNILPIIKDKKITITRYQLKKLNETRPAINNLNIVNSDISKDILKERVD